MHRHPSILLLDDSTGECELFRLALAKTSLDVTLYTEQDPEAALHFLKKVEAKAEVKLILLDWRLRNQSGDSFLKRLRADARFATIPVLVFTTSDDTSDLSAAYGNGANGYVVKPATFDQLVDCVRDLCSFWIKWNRTSEELARC
jgi:DNA-binding response OmpR family regulator